MEQLQNKSYQRHQDWLSDNSGIYAKHISKFNEIYSNKNELRSYFDFLVNTPLLPLLNKEHKWFTVGDCMGTDAHWLSKYCGSAVATDISDTFLKTAKNEGYIKEFSQQNAEQLTLSDNSFDYAFCREAYHHFPRPYIAVYEMLRCVKKGVVFSEPHDIVQKMPMLLFLCNILDSVRNPVRSWKVWKNRFSFESVGNFVYKISQREFEKLAMGIGLPAVAFYYSNVPYEKRSLKKMKAKRCVMNIFSALKILPYIRLTAILFKTMPDEATVSRLRKQGYMFYRLPDNPYTK